MIDLNDLQKEIDTLLDNETDDSLLNWYMSKQFPAYKSVLGEGNFVDFNLDTICIEVEPTQTSAPINKKGESVIKNTQYAMAA